MLPRPRIGGRLNGKATAPGMAAIWGAAGDDGLRRSGAVGALLVGLEADDEEGAVGRRDVVDEVQADDRDDALDRRIGRMMSSTCLDDLPCG